MTLNNFFCNAMFIGLMDKLETSCKNLVQVIFVKVRLPLVGAFFDELD